MLTVLLGLLGLVMVLRRPRWRWVCCSSVTLAFDDHFCHSPSTCLHLWWSQPWCEQITVGLKIMQQRSFQVPFYVTFIVYVFSPTPLGHLCLCKVYPINIFYCFIFKPTLKKYTKDSSWKQISHIVIKICCHPIGESKQLRGSRSGQMHNVFNKETTSLTNIKSFELCNHIINFPNSICPN